MSALCIAQSQRQDQSLRHSASLVAAPDTFPFVVPLAWDARLSGLSHRSQRRAVESPPPPAPTPRPAYLSGRGGAPKANSTKHEHRFPDRPRLRLAWVAT